MSHFSASEAALEGFRLARQRPKVVLAWALAHAIFGFAMVPIFIGIGAERLAEFEAAAQQDAGLGEMFSGLVENWQIYLLLLPPGLLLPAVMSAALYRALLRPGDSRFAYLRLGADELRLAALTVIRILLVVLVVPSLLFVGTLVTALAYSFAGGVAGGVIGFLAGFVVLAAMVVLYVRLSLAPLITFGEHHISVFKSWGVTRGSFWPLLGAYLLAFFAYLVILACALILAALVVLAATRGDLEAMRSVFDPSYADLESYFTAPNILWALFGALLNAAYYCIVFAPGAVAYRALSGGSPEAPEAPPLAAEPAGA